MKPPTLKDVATRAGVSTGSASAVLNGGNTGTRVSEGTRQRILSAATELRYHPNANAQGLRRKRVQCFSVLFDYAQAEIPPVASPYAGAFLEGVLRVGQEKGYNLLLYSRTWVSAAISAPLFRSQQTDGVIVAAPVLGSDTVAGLHSLGIPLVTASSDSGIEGVPWVDVDNAQGARLAAAHLIGLGHTRIAHLKTRPDNVNALVRREAFWEALRGHGVQPRPEYDALERFESEYLIAETRRLLALPEPPTALFAWNDLAARSALEGARQAGVSVPEQLSIIGFDDLPDGNDAPVPLTTIRQPVRELGEAATRLLIARIEGQETTPNQVLPVSLVVRHSTAPPP
jgi:LacI family transcriptional regulator